MNIKNVVVVGLGESGFSCISHLAKQTDPMTIIGVDTRDNPPKLSELKQLFPQVPVYTGDIPAEVIAIADMLVLSPGISKDHPKIAAVVKAGVPIIGDIELFAQSVKAPVVAITGSNGKSTVTTLIGEMAKEAGVCVAVGGNLGTPALLLLSDKIALYVLELSSFQLELTYSLNPKVAVVLNLSPDHLDRYVTLDNYYQSKQRVFQHCERLVVNREDDYVLPRIPENCQDLPVISFGLNTPHGTDYGLLEVQSEGLHSKPSIWIAKGQQPLIPLSDLKLFGRHNVANVLAALALGDSIQLPLAAMLKTLRRFTGLAHRCEWVRELNAVQWINDSKGTNVAATQSVIEGLAQDISGKWVLIAGGVGKNADFSPLKPVIIQHCRSVILMGEVAKELYTLLSSDIKCVIANSMNEAVLIASQEAKAGDGVLMSPACASFDMFRNFEHRGDVFKELVLQL
jgi:UDP-N-acetylmuramoylalanine--D-glutamate ligase